MTKILGLLTIALSVLATVWAYNKFSGKSIASLGAGSSTTAVG